jgi:hypothetical protein
MDGNLVGIPLLTCSPTSDIGFFYHIIKHSTLSQVHTFIFADLAGFAFSKNAEAHFNAGLIPRRKYSEVLDSAK